jgi:membrane-associated phospholipid phosphatase
VGVLNRRGLPLMIWGALSGGAYEVIELWARRPRPDAHLVHVVRHTTGWSFPSGHALFFCWFASYLLLILGRRLPRPIFVLGWFAQGAILALVAIGRVDMAEHWPSDVLAGLLLGAAWALFGLSVRRLSDPVLDA